MDIKNIIRNIFNKYGYEIDEFNHVSDVDSISFISIVIDIENELGIEVPDDILNQSLLNIDILINVITTLI